MNHTAQLAYRRYWQLATGNITVALTPPVQRFPDRRFSQRQPLLNNNKPAGVTIDTAAEFRAPAS